MTDPIMFTLIYGGFFLAFLGLLVVCLYLHSRPKKYTVKGIILKQLIQEKYLPHTTSFIVDVSQSLCISEEEVAKAVGFTNKQIEIIVAYVIKERLYDTKSD